MRFYPAFLGGLALLATALPVTDVAKKPETTLSIRDQDVALPEVGISIPTQTAIVELATDGLEHGDVLHDFETRAKKSSGGKSKAKAKKPAKKTKTKKPATKTKTKTPATKTKTPKASKTKSPSTKTSKASKVSHTPTAASCPLPVKIPGGALACSPETCGRAGKKTKTSKNGKVARALEYIRQDLPLHVRHLFIRADALHLTKGEIVKAINQGNQATSEKTSGPYRMLHHGSAMVKPDPAGRKQAKLIPRTPLDASFDKFQSGSEFYRNFDGLTGCTGVMIVSPQGIYAAHIWESAFVGDKAAVLRNLKKGDPDKKATQAPKSPLPPSWLARDQLGFLDYGSGSRKIAQGAWSDPGQMHVAIFAPAGDPVKTVGALTDAIKSAIPGIPAGNFHTSHSYEAIRKEDKFLEKIADDPSVGSMTAYFDGQGKLGVYGEEKLIFSMDVAPCPAGQGKKGGKCVVMK